MSQTTMYPFLCGLFFGYMLGRYDKKKNLNERKKPYHL
jgi:hypothetical protein